jgi:DNA-binding NarL/FixJ family response regulator
VRAVASAARDLEQELAVQDEARERLAQIAIADASARVAVQPDWEEVRSVNAELRALSQRVGDADLRAQLLGLSARLAQSAGADRSGGSPPATAPALSAREIDVLACVAVGYTNADVAAQLGVLPETVKSYLRSAMRKLGAHTRLEAVSAARRSALLP